MDQVFFDCENLGGKGTQCVNKRSPGEKGGIALWKNWGYDLKTEKNNADWGVMPPISRCKKYERRSPLHPRFYKQQKDCEPDPEGQERWVRGEGEWGWGV